MQVLTEAEAAEAKRRYRKLGWLAEMVRHVKRVDADPTTITHAGSALDLFNVRFRPETAQLCDPLKLAKTSDPI